MTLRIIVAALGGDVWAGGHQALIPRPHGPKHDRSVSLRLNSDQRVLVNCYSGQTTWQEVLDYLRDQNLIDAQNRIIGAGGGAVGSHAGAPPPPTDVERFNAARRIWDSGRGVEKTPTAAHALLRRVRRPVPSAETLRHSSAVHLRAYEGTGPTKAAALVAMTDPTGAFCAVEIHYLEPNGQKARGLKIPRKTIAPIPRGSAVRVDPADTEMLVAEGFWTTLSATERFSLPGWALTSTSRLRFWTPPPGVKRVLIAGDNGPDGRQSAEFLEHRIVQMGLHARAVFPKSPAVRDDWSDLAPPLDQPPIHETPPWTA